MIHRHLNPSLEFSRDIQTGHIYLGIVSVWGCFDAISLGHSINEGSIEKRRGPRIRRVRRKIREVCCSGR